jgi:hypothetical protein
MLLILLVLESDGNYIGIAKEEFIILSLVSLKELTLNNELLPLSIYKFI